MYKKIIYVIILTMLVPLSGFAQKTINADGKVLNAENEPVAGVIITQPEGKILGTTEPDGTFHLRAPKGEKLMFYLEGYEPVTEWVSRNMLIYLKEKAIHLDEVLIQSDPLRDITRTQAETGKITQAGEPRNVADLFREIAGVHIQKRSATAMEPSLRSFKYEEMNVKINGATKVVNACPNRMDPATAHLIPESVQKIEVIKGPYTVRYGQLFGGMVNIVTHQKPQPGWHGNLQSGFETNGKNYISRAEVSYMKKRWDVQLDGEYRNFGDYTDGDGIRVPAAFTHKSYSCKLGYSPGPHQRLQLDWHQKFASGIKHAGLMMDSPKDNSNVFSLDYKKEKMNHKMNAIVLKTYYSFVDHLMTNGYGMKEPRPNYPAIDARSPVISETFGGKLETRWKISGKFKMFAGMDADIIYRNGTKNVVRNINPNTGVPLDPPIHKSFKIWQDAYIYDYGLFAENHYRINSGMLIRFGLRADYVLSGAQDPDPGLVDIYGDIPEKVHIVPAGNLSLQYRLGKWHLQGTFGRGTRTPSMSERYIYRFTIGNDNRPYIGNPDLKPEVNNQIELSAERNYQNLHLGGSIFYSYLQDYITPVLAPSLAGNSGGCGTGTVVPKQFRNVQAYQYGFDISARYKPSDVLTLYSDLTWLKTYDISLNEALALIAPPSAHVSAKYEKNNISLKLNTELVAPQNDYAPSFDETRTPGHVVMDFVSVWKPLKGLSLGGSVSNILNSAYYNHVNFGYINAEEFNGRRIYEPGRNFSMYIKYHF